MQRKLLLKILYLTLFLITMSSCHSRNIENKVNEQSFQTKLTTFEKAIKEVSYAYYMRGSYLHYNLAKGKGRVLPPEESTSQDYNYMACALYVMNVYKELLGIDLSCSDGAYSRYAKKYIGKRKEVIGYGKLQTNGDLYWYEGTNNKEKLNIIVNPSQQYILSKLKIGDILDHRGHVMLIYDLIYDNNGNIIDAYLLNSTASGGGAGAYYSKTKNHGLSARMFDLARKKISLMIGYAPWSSLYYNNRDNNRKYEESLPEGTVTLETFSERANRDGALLFDKQNPKNKYKEYYSILRLVDTNENKQEVLNFDGQYYEFRGDTIDNKAIEYPASVLSRVKFKKIFIEKTVDKRDGNIVAPNDKLTYKISIKNNSNKKYEDDLEVSELLSEHVTYESFNIKSSQRNKKYDKNAIFKQNGRLLKWNLGKLNCGEEVIIDYSVKIQGNCSGKVIESNGKVGNISSGVVRNKVGRTLTKDQQALIKQKFDSLKGTLNGKQLINEVYKQACNLDLGLQKFNIRANSKEDANGLIYFNQKWGGRNWNEDSYMSISSANASSRMVLNSYFNALYEDPVKRVSYNGVNIKIYALPSLGLRENDPNQRADTIYPTDFKTGDILIYTNSNDITYPLIKGTCNTRENYITYEDGEYSYIFIEGRGFVGVNLGKDGIAGTRDDRNEFNVNYYKNNGLTFYLKTGNPVVINDEMMEWLHYQTLFGKDYYVILRPSLSM